MTSGGGCGVDDREGEELSVSEGNNGTFGKVVDVGVSIAMSSLMDELARRGKGGGGVRIRSSNVFQNSCPIEFLSACCEKFTEGRRSSEDSLPMMSVSSSIASTCAGEDAAVTLAECPVLESGLGSPSLTCLMTSASRRHSLSTGELSSCKAARILAKVFGLG